MDDRFVSTRELKNNTNKILHSAASGNNIVVTRYGKPFATIKPFDVSDIQESNNSVLLEKLKKRISAKQPELSAMSDRELASVNDELSRKIQGFSTWQDIDRAAKGDKYDISR